jgi:hypothetical protein
MRTCSASHGMVSSTDCCDHLTVSQLCKTPTQVRRHRHIAAEQRVRLIHGGMELTGDQTLPPLPCVVHCTLTSAPRPEQAPVATDWVRSDPILAYHTHSSIECQPSAPGRLEDVCAHGMGAHSESSRCCTQLILVCSYAAGCHRAPAPAEVGSGWVFGVCKLQLLHRRRWAHGSSTGMRH